MRPLYGMFLCFGLLIMLVAGSVGCQAHIGGQTLPSGYYLQDDIQYYSAGSKNTLQNEAMKLQNE